MAWPRARPSQDGLPKYTIDRPSLLKIDMPVQEIPFDEVAAAAQDLIRRGLPVTIGHLRESLPTASALSIHKHLGAWRAGQAKPAVAHTVEVPDAIKAALESWAQQLVQDAAAPLRETLSHADDDLASLLAFNAQAETERDDMGTQLAEITAGHEQALAKLAERDAAIGRLTVEVRHARDIASNALVGKAKDQLAIDGKDAQIVELRREIERLIAVSAAASDARLSAEMELVGAVTGRDNFAAEIAELRAQLDSRHTALRDA